MGSSEITPANFLAASAKATLAKNLALARMAKDMTQEQLADAARLSRATIAQIEGGDGDPRLSTLIGIATALEISPILLLMDERDLEVLVKMVQEGPDNLRKHCLSVSNVEQMRRLLETGLAKNRIRAAKIGVAAVHAGAVGAAIGSALLPGLGTTIGALLAASIGVSIAAIAAAANRRLEEEQRRDASSADPSSPTD